MKTTLLLVAALLLSGCVDRVVSRIEHAERSSNVTKTQSCNKSGMCYRCRTEFGVLSGNVDYVCGMQYSTTCPGTETVTVRRTPVTVSYESGRKDERYIYSAPIVVHSICK